MVVPTLRFFTHILVGENDIDKKFSLKMLLKKDDRNKPTNQPANERRNESEEHTDMRKKEKNTSDTSIRDYWYGYCSGGTVGLNCNTNCQLKYEIQHENMIRAFTAYLESLKVDS